MDAKLLTREPPKVGPSTVAAGRLERVLRVTALALLAIGALRLAALAGWIAADPEARIARIPDDTYYYLTLARHFAESGRWTFDGVAPATGFHLLHGYALAGLASLRPGESTFVSLAVLLGALAALPALGVAMGVAWRGPLIVAAALAALVWWPKVALNFGTGMEWGWVLSIGAFYWLAARRRWPLWSLAALGVAGSLARTDFLFLPLVIAGWGLFDRSRLRPALVGLSGAALGLAIVALHRHGISGD